MNSIDLIILLFLVAIVCFYFGISVGTSYGDWNVWLNMKLEGHWCNMGYWRGTECFIEANKSLALMIGERLEIRKESLILEVGCGCGDASLFLKKRYGGRWKCTTIEKKQIEIAKEKCRGEVEIEFKQANAVDFDDGKYDRIIAIDCAYHFKTRERFLRNAYAMLEDDGIICLSDICPQSKVSAIAKSCLSYFSFPKENCVTLKEYRALLENIGYKNIEIECVEDDVFPKLADFIQKRNKWLRVFGNFQWKALVLFSRLLQMTHRKTFLHFVIVRATK